MVAEVVLSMMGNRSDRRFPNLICTKALEAVSADQAKARAFPSGPGALSMLPTKAGYMAATDYTHSRQTPFRSGLGPYMVQKIGQATAAV